MTSMWIVHRESATRAALARLAAAPDGTPTGAPGDPHFDAAAAPDVVLLGLTPGLEAELEFAHRAAGRLPRSRWILVGEAGVLARAGRLFDTLPAERIAFPPQPARLRAAIRSAAAAAALPLSLSQRAAREALAARFASAFGDVELPALLRALDPRLARVPVLVLGEPGSGRRTLGRYVHHFGASAGGALAALACGPETRGDELLERMDEVRRDPRSLLATAVCLEDASRLAPAVQRQLRDWIEFGPPEGVLASPRVRWIATAEEGGLEPELRRALGGIELRLAPLRERRDAIAGLAQALAAAWSAAHHQRPRRLGGPALAALEEYPWPGNLRELEAVIDQSLAASGAEVLGAADLVLDGEPFAPAGALAVVARAEAAGEEAVPATAEEDEGEPLSLPELIEEDAGGAAEAPAAPSGGLGAAELRRLTSALGHELRNPLTAVRTFVDLLPERHADPSFRDAFGRLALRSLDRVQAALDRIAQVAELGPPASEPVDVGALLEEVLDARRERAHERRLLVLEELDRSHPAARGDRAQLRLAFEALLDECLELVPERGDLYLASRRHAAGQRSLPGVRVLLRFRGPDGAAAAPARPELAPAAQSLGFALAELLIRAQGGSLTVDTAERHETVVVADLPG